MNSCTCKVLSTFLLTWPNYLISTSIYSVSIRFPDFFFILRTLYLPISIRSKVPLLSTWSLRMPGSPSPSAELWICVLYFISTVCEPDS